MADQKRRLPTQQAQPIDNHEGRSQQQDDREGNLASSQRGLTEVQRDAQLPDPALLAQLVQANPYNQGMQQMQTQGLPAPADAQGAANLDQPATQYRPAGSRITKEMLQKAMRTLHKYRAGKASVERRIIDAQQWWKLHNWEQIEAQDNLQGSHDSKTSTAWLWNCFVG